jgi:hypothetical protein
VHGGTWIGVACWWYLPSHVNQLDVPVPRVDHVGITSKSRRGHQSHFLHVLEIRVQAAY